MLTSAERRATSAAAQLPSTIARASASADRRQRLVGRPAVATCARAFDAFGTAVPRRHVHRHDRALGAGEQVDREVVEAARVDK